MILELPNMYQRLLPSARLFAHGATALMLVASAVRVHAFVVGDYRIKYVQH